MGHINTRLASTGATYETGVFDGQRLEHAYLVRGPGGLKFKAIFIVLNEMGNIGTAANVYPALVEHGPSAAFILGIAGTLDVAEIGIGDVVISSAAKFLGPDKVQTVDPSLVAFAECDGTETAIVLDAMKRMGSQSWLRFRRDAVEFNSSKSLIASFLRDTASPGRFQGVDARVLSDPDSFSKYGNSKPSMRTGAILGSEWVVDSSEFVEFLLERDRDMTAGWYATKGDAGDKERNIWRNDSLACLDMESYGFFRSLRAYKVNKGGSGMHGFSVRGISDPCNNKHGLEKASKKAIREIAVHNAIEALIDLMFHVVNSDLSRRS